MGEHGGEVKRCHRPGRQGIRISTVVEENARCLHLSRDRRDVQRGHPVLVEGFGSVAGLQTLPHGRGVPRSYR